MKNKIWKLCILVMIPLVIWFIPPPEGLTELSWRLSGFYLAAICGLILKPFSEAVVLLGVVGFAGFFLNNTSQILVGYATSTVWLVFAAFGISISFVKTGLGRRIAFHMIRFCGSTTLRLGYRAICATIKIPGRARVSGRSGCR
ncbi:transporter%2C divalent anion:Na+ symporter (DASS) family [Yersinia pseudotuberculosis]|nr:transporter%2C divalent anion:Na+ symporter (DASS) family [Yersinia pseudotuberculosis]